MKIIELLIVITIFSMTSICVFQTICSINKSVESVNLEIAETEFVLKNDLFFRNKIWNIDISYWNNFNSICDIEILKLKSMKLKDVEIVRVEKILDGSKKVTGILIEWKYMNKTYITKESLRSFGI